MQITTTSFLYSSCMYLPWRAPSKACLEWADCQRVSHQFQELQISSLSGPLCSLSAQADWHGRDLKDAIFQKVQIPCSDRAFLAFFLGWCVFKMVESNFCWHGSCFFCWKDSEPASKEKKFILFFNPTEHWKNTSSVQRYLHWRNDHFMYIIYIQNKFLTQSSRVYVSHVWWRGLGALRQAETALWHHFDSYRSTIWFGGCFFSDWYYQYYQC